MGCFIPDLNMVLCFGCKREGSLLPSFGCFRGKGMQYSALLQSGTDLEKEHLQEALILRDMLASCSASCLCCGWPMLSSKWWHLPSYFPYPLLNPIGCQVTSRHGTSVLQEVHSIEYQGLDSPSKSLEKNGLLFSPHFRLGGALFKLPFYVRENIFFFYNLMALFH